MGLQCPHYCVKTCGDGFIAQVTVERLCGSKHTYCSLRQTSKTKARRAAAKKALEHMHRSVDPYLKSPAQSILNRLTRVVGK